MSDEIQQNRYDQILRRVAGIIGPGSKVSQVITELFPMINVEDLPAELLILGGTRIAFGGGAVFPVIGFGSFGALFNPADSATLVTITRIDFAVGVDTNIRWGVTTVRRGDEIATQLFRDTRNLSPNRPVAAVLQGTSATLAPGTNQTVISANTPWQLEGPDAVCVLAPGTGFEIGSGQSDLSFNFSFQWRERAALPSELNLRG